MQYVPFGSHGFQVSRLGFGTMRLPVFRENDQEKIDRPAAIKLLRQGIDGGITYIDTAYPYHHFESEIVTGLALKDGYREKVKLTTKLPPWFLKEEKDMNRILDEQLKKLDLPYVDFYLLHALNRDSFAKFQAFHYKDFMKQALKDGRIRHAGFSFHDDYETYLKILHDWDQWGMSQIQFNYLDDDQQATEKGLREAGKMGIPLVIMEPLRGGALANPPTNVASLIDAHEKKRSAVEWAFSFIADYPEVVTILSGMSNEAQLLDNLRLFDTFTVGGLTNEDKRFIHSLKEAYLSRMPIGCTGCAYCQPCPRGVTIPDLFKAYNESIMFEQPRHFIGEYKDAVKENQDASRCVRCGKCESVCPQQLPITEWLARLNREYNEAQ